jgi:hypothetical protein
VLDAGFVRARALEDLGELDAAADAMKDVAIHRREQLGPDHPDTVEARLMLSEIEEQRGELDAAVAAGEEALAGISSAIGHTDLRARAEFRVAALLAKHDRTQRTRARALAESALRHYETSERDADGQRTRDIERWLRRHRR